MDLLRGQRNPPRKKKISFLIIRTTEKGERNNQPAGIFAGSDFVKVFRDMARANAVRPYRNICENQKRLRQQAIIVKIFGFLNLFIKRFKPRGSAAGGKEITVARKSNGERF